MMQKAGAGKSNPNSGFIWSGVQRQIYRLKNLFQITISQIGPSGPDFLTMFF